MEFDFVRVFERIRSLVGEPGPIVRKMHLLIDTCEAGYPHVDWASFRQLPYADDTASLRRWFSELLLNEPPVAQIAALWFGLFNPVRADDSPSADFHVVGSTTFDAEDESFSWAVDATYTPVGGEAHSVVLDRIYQKAYSAPESLGNIAEYSLCLGYAAFAVIEMVGSVELRSIGAPPLGLAVGFDSGDGLLLGTLTAEGLSRTG